MGQPRFPQRGATTWTGGAPLRRDAVLSNSTSTWGTPHFQRWTSIRGPHTALAWGWLGHGTLASSKTQAPTAGEKHQPIRSKTCFIRLLLVGEGGLEGTKTNKRKERKCPGTPVLLPLLLHIRLSAKALSGAC